MTVTPAAPLTNPAAAPEARHARAIGPLGTAARTLVGVALLALGIAAGGRWITWWQLALGIIGMPAVALAAQCIRLAFARGALSQTGHVASCFNCAVLFALLWASPSRNATLVFLGASMLLAAARGYGGCESLAISNWLLRRNDHVGCLLFLPIDELEARGGHRPAGPGESPSGR